MTNENAKEAKDIGGIIGGMDAPEFMDLIGTPITIAGDDMVIRYANRAAVEMFKKVEGDIKKDLPNFNAEKLVGVCVDDFHKNPAHQRGMIAGLKEMYTGSLDVGGLTYGFMATPKFNSDGKLAGIVVEWQDNTAVVARVEEGRQLAREFENMAIAHDSGDIDVFADRAKFGPDFANVVDAVNGMVQGHIQTLEKTIAFAQRLAANDHGAQLEQFPGKKASINESMEQVREVVRANAEEVGTLVSELNKMSEVHELGDIDHVIDVTKFKGGFADVAANVNAMVNAHITTKKKAIAFVVELANGNFDAELEQFPRQKAFINEAMEKVRANFKGVVAEVEAVAKALVDGNFDIEVETSRYSGAFRSLLETMTAIIGNFDGVINEIERLSNGIVSGKLDTNVDITRFRGAYGSIMRAFDSAFTSLNSAFGTINNQVKQITSTVDSMSQASQALATNSQIQSSSVDEVSSSTEQTESQVKSNATAAASARDLVVGASVVAADGKVKIGEMVNAMDGIRASSQDIAKIIKVIDEIAFQTNLLALNAAVEAARAGQHGRGFAVVAQEVRNLAGRSAKAARETSELIESATVRVQEGVRIADETSSAFTSIVDDIEKVRTLVGDIATASDEQSRGVAQINVAVSEIAKSALATSQQADELAASAAQMQAATENMRNEMNRFTLRTASTAMPSSMDFSNMSPELMAQIQQMLAAQGNSNSAPSPRAKTGTINRNSDRDERGFGNF